MKPTNIHKFAKRMRFEVGKYSQTLYLWHLVLHAAKAELNIWAFNKLLPNERQVDSDKSLKFHIHLCCQKQTTLYTAIRVSLLKQ